MSAPDRISRTPGDLLPVLVARVASVDAVARIVETARDSSTLLLKLEEQPFDDALHVLELHAPGLREPITLGARRMGAQVADLTPLYLTILEARDAERIPSLLRADRNTEPADPLLGRTLGDRYRVVEILGAGAMGTIYRAHHVVLDKPVAVKVLRGSLRDDHVSTARFLREARAASRLDHSGILRVLDFGQEDDGLRYIAMELLRGRSLADAMGRETFSAERVVDVMSQILSALGAAHDEGVIHRDIKPENVMLVPQSDGSDRAVVCDFGIATTGDESLRATVAGAICGTPEYMSPEQARGEEVGPPSDLYAMGVLLFEIATGQLPFQRDTPLATVIAHLEAEPPRPSAICPSIDPRLEAVILRALEKNPAARFADAREMRSALREPTGPAFDLVPSLPPNSARSRNDSRAPQQESRGERSESSVSARSDVRHDSPTELPQEPDLSAFVALARAALGPTPADRDAARRHLALAPKLGWEALIRARITGEATDDGAERGRFVEALRELGPTITEDVLEAIERATDVRLLEDLLRGATRTHGSQRRWFEVVSSMGRHADIAVRRAAAAALATSVAPPANGRPTSSRLRPVA